MATQRVLSVLLACTAAFSTASCAALLERAQRPEAPAERSVELPQPTRVQLSNGLTLLVVERHNLPIVSVSSVFHAGEALSPAGKAGLATLTADLLRRGTARRSAPAIAEAIEFVGGSLDSSAGLDSASVSVSVLRKDLDLGLELLADSLMRPTFPQAELERLREEYQAGLRAMLDDGDDVLRRAFTTEVLAGHPYGQASTLTSLGRITRQDVLDFYRRHYGPDNGFVAVVGDITPAEAKARFERALASWQPTKGDRPAVTAPRPTSGRKVVFVDMPVNQSYIRLGNVSAKRNTPDYFPLIVMNQILGAEFTSRLNQSLRDRQGLAYGAGSGLAMSLHGGTFFAGLNTKTESTAKALEGLLAEVRRIQQEPVSAEELQLAKDYLTGSFPLRFETNADLAREVVNLELFGLPRDYLATYRERVRAVSADDVQRVAKRYLDADGFTLVVVGQGGSVEQALRAYGPVKKVERGNLIK